MNFFLFHKDLLLAYVQNEFFFLSFFPLHRNHCFFNFAKLLRVRNFFNELGTIIWEYSCFSKSVKNPLSTNSVCVRKFGTFRVDMYPAFTSHLVNFALCHLSMARS